ncbi:hypothetical protein QBC39DRAFT_260200 [Podospora conica]|nr:hypothetical protein QBC39DRAFT_260200 [Schizothecium conicum]
MCQEKNYPRRTASEGDVIPGRSSRRSPTRDSRRSPPRDGRRSPPRDGRRSPPRDVPSDRRRTRRPDPRSSKGKGRELIGGRAFETGPLTEWPPEGMSSREELTLGPAMRLISRGVPAFKGHKRSIPHASDDFYALFATAAGNKGEDTDAANQHDSLTQLMTLRLVGPLPATYPWETLEQPSYSFCYGRRPGTITLNHWVNMASVLPPSIALRDAGVLPRETTLERILERLRELERGLEDDDEDLMYKNLYRRFLRDPDKYLAPHRTLDKQITDLIMVLSRPDWIDFTLPRNHVVTKFIYDTSAANTPTFTKFFHQVLLSAELDLRITSRHHHHSAAEKLLSQIPPTIQWSLAVARRWREHMRIDALGPLPSDLVLRLKLKHRQARLLKRFAQRLKWPNLAATLAALKARSDANTLDSISSHATAFFSGLVLPGPTFPFLAINALIDLDPDPQTDHLALLTHLHPHCGFQYRSAATYWSASCVVGKVLAPTCPAAAAGWIGPARPTSDLARSQIARVRSRPPPAGLTQMDVRTMSERSDPLGPPAQVFPVREYKLVGPKSADSDLDLVRIELLRLKPCSKARAPTTDSGPGWFDATVWFAIDGVSWPVRLRYDVRFVEAWPCSEGPHVLFFDYVFVGVRADEVVGMEGWGGGGGGRGSDSSGGSEEGKGKGKGKVGGGGEEGDEEKVLVVEAFGVADNEVLARAWCASWGLSAVVADVGRTCMACAIREAYAATLTVVILVDGGGQDGTRDD